MRADQLFELLDRIPAGAEVLLRTPDGDLPLEDYDLIQTAPWEWILVLKPKP